MNLLNNNRLRWVEEATIWLKRCYKHYKLLIRKLQSNQALIYALQTDKSLNKYYVSRDVKDVLQITGSLQLLKTPEEA